MKIFDIQGKWSGYEIPVPERLQKIFLLPLEERLTALVDYIQEMGQLSREILILLEKTKEEIITLLFSSLQVESVPVPNVLMRYFVPDLKVEQQLFLIHTVESIMKKEPKRWRELLRALVENISEWSGEAQYEINRLLDPRTDTVGREALMAQSKEAAQDLSSARISLFANYVKTLSEEAKSNEKWPQAIEYLFTMLLMEDKRNTPILLMHAGMVVEKIFIAMITSISKQLGEQINLGPPPPLRLFLKMINSIFSWELS